MTTIKICFNTEIHRTQNLPANLQDFIKHTESLFLSSLPENWLLHYIDNDGDKIMITDQKDYDEFKDLNHSSTTVTKVYIVQTKTFGVNKFKPEEEIAIMEEVAAKKDVQHDELIQVEEEKVEKVHSPRVEESRPDLWEEKKEEESDTVKTPGAENKQFCVDADVLDELMSTMVDNSILEEKKDEENIAEKRKEASESEIIHYGIACNGCGQNPILGARFKCTTCPNFSYCENCERANEHPHNLLKMKHRDIHDVFQPVPAQPVVIEKVKNVDASFNARMNKRLKKLITFIKGGDKVDSSSENDKVDKKGKIDKKERAYYDSLMKKVKALKKKFPKADIDVLCAYVNGAPDDMNIDELIANYRI